MSSFKLRQIQLLRSYRGAVEETVAFSIDLLSYREVSRLRYLSTKELTTTDKVIVESANDSEDSSNDEVPKKLTLQKAYDKPCTEFIKSKKTSHLCRKVLNKVKTEKADLLIKLDGTIRLVETLVVENTSLEEKVKNLEVELS